MTSKVCCKCKEEKPRSEFSKAKSRKDGLQSQCKSCLRQSNKQWRQENHERVKQYRQENREKIAEYKKQYYQENREKRLEYFKKYYQENHEKYKQWRQENREKIAEQQKQYRQENREKRLEYKKQWHQENREKVATHNAKRRALKRDGIPEALVDCPIEKERITQVYALRELLTKATGTQYHVDHIVPLSKGGPHWSGNLQIITAEENLSKYASYCEDTARIIEESLDEHLSSRQ